MGLIPLAAIGRWPAFCLAVLLWPLGAGGQSAPVELEALERSFVELADRVTPSVVAIETTRGDQPAPHRLSGDVPMVGSGVVIDAGGLIATNDHVVRSGDRIWAVLAGGRRVEAELVGSDPRSDLAVIRVPVDGLAPARLGDASAVRVGQWAFSAGNPFGTAGDGHPSVTYGIVSALGKRLPSLEEGGDKYYGNLIQVTSGVHPGNSGGPLFNIAGEVIGINTATEDRDGTDGALGYAIPISERTRAILAALSSGGEVAYGFLGVDLRGPRGRGRERGPAGARIQRVYEPSPAASAGLREDDLILAYDGLDVQGVDHVIRLVSETPVGATVSLRLLRDGAEVAVPVTIAKRDILLAEHQ